MKLKNFVTIGFVIIAANINFSSALAQVQPGWNRPIFQSNMVVTDIQQGAWLKDSNSYDSKIVLVLTQQDGSNQKGISINIDNDVTLFAQVREIQEDCAVIYEGSTSGLAGKGDDRLIEIRLEDISACDITIQPMGTWRATLSEVQPGFIGTPETDPSIVNSVEMMGNPETIYTTFGGNTPDFDQILY